MAEHWKRLYKAIEINGQKLGRIRTHCMAIVPSTPWILENGYDYLPLYFPPNANPLPSSPSSKP